MMNCKFLSYAMKRKEETNKTAPVHYWRNLLKHKRTQKKGQKVKKNSNVPPNSI